MGQVNVTTVAIARKKHPQIDIAIGANPTYFFKQEGGF